jgi:hypothetical protein
MEPCYPTAAAKTMGVGVSPFGFSFSSSSFVLVLEALDFSSPVLLASFVIEVALI